jgi:hypothetical protein
MKIDLAIEELHRSEGDLAEHLLHMSDRHKVDHEVFHLCRDLASWSKQHVRELARIGARFGVDLSEDAPESGPLAGMRQKAAELLGRRSEPGLLLLADLRHLYRAASGASLDWEILAQTAQAAKESELLELAERLHPETLRQAKWANAKLKESSAQIMVS